MTKLLDHRGREMRHTAQYMRPDKTGILSMRRAITRDVRDDVRAATGRAFGLATDFLHNSGWISGAADQIIADINGTELKLNCRPDLSRLGYDEQERAAWCRLVETEWRRWSRNARECHLEGDATVQEILDGAVRYYLASGEAIAVIDYMGSADRARYGLSTGTKVRLVSPHRLTSHTSMMDGWDQGIYRDELGRARFYRFRRNVGGLEQDIDVPVMDGGVSRILHALDRGATPNSGRGISPMVAAFKVIAQSDQLADTTLTTALLQTAFAATIKSPEPSDLAFQALQQLTNMGEEFQGAADLAADYFEMFQQRMDALKSKSLSIGGDTSQVNHLGPGEELDFHHSQTPGAQYLSFQQNLMREVARCLGMTFESLTMDHSKATYSSVRMAGASIWPTIIRRRERIAAPIAQGIYAAWLDEMIGRGVIPIKGLPNLREASRAFRANRRAVCDAEWRGPARPSADPYKDALADKLRLEQGTTTLQSICAERGLDWEENLDQIERENRRLTDMGIVSPFGRMSGGEGAGPQGGAADGMREASTA